MVLAIAWETITLSSLVTGAIGFGAIISRVRSRWQQRSHVRQRLFDLCRGADLTPLGAERQRHREAERRRRQRQARLIRKSPQL